MATDILSAIMSTSLASHHATRLKRLGAAAAVLAVLVTTGCGPDSASSSQPAPQTVTVTATPSESTSPTPTASAAEAPANGAVPDDSDTQTAVAVLADLPIKGRAPKTGYDRDLFGQPWADVDRNGCDTRNDILNRDLDVESHKPGTDNCVVLTGTLEDPYTATTIDFQRGQDTSDDVQIDHVVALSDAWQKGAQQITAAQRVAFANDPLNLLAVDGPTNAKKGDADAATWLPPNRPYRCDYVARQIAVKAKYELWITQPEHDAMAKVLATCDTQKVPAAGKNLNVSSGQAREAEKPTQTPTPAKTTPAPKAPAQPTYTPAPKATPKPTYTPKPTPTYTPKPQPTYTPPPTKAPAAYYKNCSAARAAGAAPVRVGDPGYGSHLDRDGDGIGCE
ncbi:DUF1524 domain-containing protein [Citricoccus sp.]|uniref:GmrSD restriction endonuclease domain-containing protein n=2 Tax=Citricoccus TaxID=169133 RepID=UPI002D1FA96F|nr:DUF1524 domain-containing protein [Citricoccus sp.]